MVGSAVLMLSGGKMMYSVAECPLMSIFFELHVLCSPVKCTAVALVVEVKPGLVVRQSIVPRIGLWHIKPALLTACFSAM